MVRYISLLLAIGLAFWSCEESHILNYEIRLSEDNSEDTPFIILMHGKGGNAKSYSQKGVFNNGISVIYLDWNCKKGLLISSYCSSITSQYFNRPTGANIRRSIAQSCRSKITSRTRAPLNIVRWKRGLCSITIRIKLRCRT